MGVPEVNRILGVPGAESLGSLEAVDSLGSLESLRSVRKSSNPQGLGIRDLKALFVCGVNGVLGDIGVLGIVFVFRFHGDSCISFGFHMIH